MAVGRSVAMVSNLAIATALFFCSQALQ